MNILEAITGLRAWIDERFNKVDAGLAASSTIAVKDQEIFSLKASNADLTARVEKAEGDLVKANATITGKNAEIATLQAAAKSAGEQAVTIVAAWISAETGVGPAIASPNHDCKGNCADFPAAASKSMAPIALSATGEA